MKYELSIKEQNIQPHLDIEKELQYKKNGLFTFVIRVNSGNIVDLSILENVNVKQDYLTQTIIVQQISIAGGPKKEPSISYNNRERSASDTVRTDNF